MNPLFRIPIRLQLIIIVAIVAIPAAAIIILSGKQNKDSAIGSARRDTQSLVDTVASEQRILVSSAKQLVVTLAQLPEVNHKDAAQTNKFLARILRLHPNFNNIFVADRTGTIWASAVPFKGTVSVADRLYFKNAIAKERFSSGEYQIGRISKKPSLNMGHPYWNDEGKIAGVICVGITLESYHNLLKLTQIPSGSDLLLIDQKGVILFSATAPELQPGKQVDPALFQKMQKGPDTDTSIAAGDCAGVKRPRYMSYRKMRLEGEDAPYLYAWVGIPVESALAQANRQIARSMTLFALVLSSALFLAWFVGKRSISDRITILERASQDVAQGKLHLKVSDLIKGGELGRLCESFDAMARQLMLREKLLAEKQQQLEELNTFLEQRVVEAVSDSRKKDQLLIQQGRQAAMGEMIGNIAHQWRQPLNTLALVVQELGMTYGRAEFSKESLDANVKKAMGLITHMSQTIDDFRYYFKPSTQKSLFNLKKVVAKTLSLVEPSMKTLGIKLEVVVTEDTEINGYANEYSQVLLNILLNSKDAFEGRSKGIKPTIRITISKENDKSVVTVADNAGGISEGVIDKVFDPYFTTKGPDKGTGIGLYMAKSIIEQHMDGRLTVRNRAQGAEFRIEV